jgi:hypothetical protein
MAELQGISNLSPATRSFVQVVRDYMRDHPELNRLTAGQESNDRLIAWAIMDAMAYFNGTPPIGNTTLEMLLQRNQHSLLLRLTTITLLESVGLLQTRNHINYSNGGLNVGVNDKTPLIMNWLQYYKSTTDQLLTRVKVAMNIESILNTGGGSGVHSELWAVNATYLAY